MFNRLKEFFQSKKTKRMNQNSARDFDEWHEKKTAIMQQILGKGHNIVMHAIVPYSIGGGLDLYYFPHGIPGTAIATKDLSELPDEGSSNKLFSCYELVMFTRHQLNLDDAKDLDTAFGKAHMNISKILNQIAPYSATAELNRNETCEFPSEMESVGGKCLIFDAYGYDPAQTVRGFGLLVVIEIFRSEMEFARANKGSDLLATLKASGYYPYSDLEREPVA